MKFSGLVNFSDGNQKRKFLTMAGAAQGPHEIEIKNYRPRRSNQANKYWWAVVVKAFVEFQKDQGEVWSDQRAHEFIVGEVLGKDEVINPLTGEAISSIRKETHNLNKEEFGEMIERAVVWLADFGIIVPDPKQFQQEKSCHR